MRFVWFSTDIGISCLSDDVDYGLIKQGSGTEQIEQKGEPGDFFFLHQFKKLIMLHHL